MKHLKIKVTGKVQGVWFRANTKEKANELGLSGFVKNEPDGSVYIEVSGKNNLLDDFIKWLKKGPELARVDSIEIVENDIIHKETFQIKR